MEQKERKGMYEQRKGREKEGKEMEEREKRTCITKA